MCMYVSMCVHSCVHACLFFSRFSFYMGKTEHTLVMCSLAYGNSTMCTGKTTVLLISLFIELVFLCFATAYSIGSE